MNEWTLGFVGDQQTGAAIDGVLRSSSLTILRPLLCPTPPENYLSLFDSHRQPVIGHGYGYR